MEFEILEPDEDINRAKLAWNNVAGSVARQAPNTNSSITFSNVAPVRGGDPSHSGGGGTPHPFGGDSHLGGLRSIDRI